MTKNETLNQLKLLEDFDWEAEIPGLIAYAVAMARLYQWKSPSGTLAKGNEIDDLVFSSIHKAYEGVQADLDRSPKKIKKGKRFWDMDKCPSLKVFIKGIIRSDINHLVNSAEHKTTQVYTEDTSLLTNNVSVGNSPEEDLIEVEEDYNRQKFAKDVFSKVEKELEEDENALLVLSAYRLLTEDNDFVSNQMISEEVGIEVREVENAKKRIKRKTLKICETLEGQHEEE